MPKTKKHPKWVTKNAGPEAVGKVRHWLERAPRTDLDLVAFTGLSKSAVQAARFSLGCVDAGPGYKPVGQPGRAPTKWALPEGKRCKRRVLTATGPGSGQRCAMLPGPPAGSGLAQ